LEASSKFIFFLLQNTIILYHILKKKSNLINKK